MFQKCLAASIIRAIKCTLFEVRTGLNFGLEKVNDVSMVAVINSLGNCRFQ
jgi:hypothetical protein